MERQILFTLVLIILLSIGCEEQNQKLVQYNTPTDKLKVLSENLDAFDDVEQIRELLSDGAEVDVVNKYSVTPLYIASQEGYTEIVEVLLENGAEVNVKRTTDGTTPLLIASENGYTEIVELLLENGADVDVRGTNYGDTPLCRASEEGHTEIVKLLLENGAGRFTNDPLYSASLRGHTEIVELLLENGADVNFKARVYTPLFVASMEGHTETVKLLLENGADINVKCPFPVIEMTAKDIAILQGHTEVVELIEKAGEF